MLKIYTRSGDGGETSLFDGKRVYKNDLRVEVLGEIDELNSAIGIAVVEIQNSKGKSQKYKLKFKSELINIQRDLFEIGERLTFSKKRVLEFEKMIDRLSKKLPEIKNFILPGGGKFGAALHLARAICRRVERRIVALSKKEKVDSGILTYFNRLSDLLFVMARFANYQEKKKEIVWIKN